jgi:hypothetical protein
MPIILASADELGLNRVARGGTPSGAACLVSIARSAPGTRGFQRGVPRAGWPSIRPDTHDLTTGRVAMLAYSQLSPLPA